MRGSGSKAKATMPRQLLASDWRMGKGAEPLRPVLAAKLRLTFSVGELRTHGGRCLRQHSPAGDDNTHGKTQKNGQTKAGTH